MVLVPQGWIDNKPGVVQAFVDASIEGWYDYIYGDASPGNELIKKRLDLLYPNRHSLKVDRQENQYTVELRIANGQV